MLQVVDALDQIRWSSALISVPTVCRQRSRCIRNSVAMSVRRPGVLRAQRYHSQPSLHSCRQQEIPRHRLMLTVDRRWRLRWPGPWNLLLSARHLQSKTFFVNSRMSLRVCLRSSESTDFRCRSLHRPLPMTTTLMKFDSHCCHCRHSIPSLQQAATVLSLNQTYLTSPYRRCLTPAINCLFHLQPRRRYRSELFPPFRHQVLTRISMLWRRLRLASFHWPRPAATTSGRRLVSSLETRIRIRVQATAWWQIFLKHLLQLITTRTWMILDKTPRCGDHTDWPLDNDDHLIGIVGCRLKRHFTFSRDCSYWISLFHQIDMID